MTQPMIPPRTGFYDTKNRVYADIHADPGAANGSRKFPFQSIQAAHDYIFALGDASPVNKYCIYAKSGVYNEALRFKTPYIGLFGDGFLKTVIAPTNGPALIVSDATDASLDTYFSNGGNTVANATARLGDLVHDSGINFGGIEYPEAFILQGVRLSAQVPDLLNDYCFMMITVSDALAMAADLSEMQDCKLDEGFYIRNRGQIIKHFNRIDGNTHVWNTKVFQSNFGLYVRDIQFEHDPAAAKPAPPLDTNIIASLSECRLSGSCINNGGVVFTNTFGCHLTNDFIERGTGATTVLFSSCDDVILEDAGQMTFRFAHVREDITINTPSGCSLIMEDSAVGV